MIYKEIKELSTKELHEQLKETTTALVRMKLNHKVSDIENPLLIRSTRRDVARLKTEITARRKAEK